VGKTGVGSGKTRLLCRIEMRRCVRSVILVNEIMWRNVLDGAEGLRWE
jgi:hypothetical protein